MQGSLINEIPSGNNGAVTPVVGMGATALMFSDRRPATVIAVSKSGKKITVRMDQWRRTNGGDTYYTESAKYEITPNPEGPTRDYTLRANGKWIEVGASATSCGFSIRLGERSVYNNESF